MEFGPKNVLLTSSVIEHCCNIRSYTIAYQCNESECQYIDNIKLLMKTITGEQIACVKAFVSQLEEIPHDTKSFIVCRVFKLEGLQ